MEQKKQREIFFFFFFFFNHEQRLRELEISRDNLKGVFLKNLIEACANSLYRQRKQKSLCVISLWSQVGEAKNIRPLPFWATKGVTGNIHKGPARGLAGSQEWLNKCFSLLTPFPVLAN